LLCWGTSSLEKIMWINPYPGKKIDFEGINCCGKSTQATMARSWWERSTNCVERDVVLTKEPYTKRPDGSPVASGVAIYDILGGRHSSVTLESIGLLGFQVEYFYQNRLEHFREVVIPNLSQGRHVLSDRGPASMCFGADPAMNLLPLMGWHGDAFRNAGVPHVWADAILIYDITPEESLHRLAQRSGKADGHENLETQTRVRNNYLRFSEIYPNCHVIDGSGSPQEVFARTVMILNKVLS
jgi:thymidylate kinase